MQWYYVDGGQQRGPVTETDLQQLVRSGTVRPDTLVWNEGMDNWRPYRETGAGGGASAATAAGTANGVVCRECGNVFPPDEVIRYGDAAVCARCKPVFVQRLKEGAVGSVTMDYAGFWIRVGAKIVDWLIVGVANGILAGVVAALITSQGATQETTTILNVAVTVVNTLIGMTYTVYFLYKFGATPGKMLLKIHVVTAEGGPLSLGRCFGRYFAEILSSLICGIGYLMAAFDDQKRTLHDRICNTRVIRR